MPSKQELFAMVFKTGAFKASNTRKRSAQQNKPKRNRPTQRSGCPTGWVPPKPKPKTTSENEAFSLFTFAIEDFHTHF